MMRKTKSNKNNDNLIFRWKSKTPLFWKKVINLCLKVGTSSVALIGADKMFNLQSDYNVPSIIFTVAGYLIAMTFALGLGAKLTKE